ncbi:MAG: RagB/SusD family nutrient uptake outer membrane protein [Bacteroidota bacterium]
MGCEEHLEVQPTDRINTQSFYQTEEDAIGAINAAYAPLQYEGSFKLTLWALGDVMSDDALMGGAGAGDDIAVNRLESFTATADNEKAYILWAAHYSGIYYSNVVLQKIPEMDIDEDLKERILGEAYFLRATYYFYLAFYFGDVPLYTTVPDPTDLNVSRTPVEKVWEQVISDYQEAGMRLPESYTGNDIGRAIKGGAYGMLAKTYLILERWQDCIDACEKVEGIARHRLLDNYADLWNYLSSNNNDEVLFDIQHHYYEGGWNGTGNYISEFTAPRYQFIGENRGWGWGVPSVAHVENTYEPGDTREHANIIAPGDSIWNQNKGGWYIHKAEYSPYSGYNVKKYLFLEYNGTNASMMFFPLNFHVLRLADVLLMHAEAINELNGGSAEAHELLNIVRRRAFKDTDHDLTGLSQAELREAIYKERRAELFFEGWRWIDLVRTERVTQVMWDAGKTNFDPDKHVLLPIPQNELNINPKLTQNPKY